MNSLLLRTLAVPRNSSLQAFADYKKDELVNVRQAVTQNGTLLEYETLELRVHPPNVTVDNETYDDRTVITVDSANRPGTLVEVVQCLTELGLNVRKARISSDGGWFVDEFHVTETSGRKVTDEEKLKTIRKLLSIEYDVIKDSEVGTNQADEARQCSTVFELCGQDRSGLLADVVQLLTSNNCDVRSAAVWTYKKMVAFVVSVLERGRPIQEEYKATRLRQMLLEMMDSSGNGTVTCEKVIGPIHYERRLHLLMLKEELKEWHSSVARREVKLLSQQETSAKCVTSSHGLSTDEDLSHLTSPKYSRPEVIIQHYGHLNYWMVTIKCKDRNKLFFDTVCTLADLNYDIYHGAIDSEGDTATQLYYIRPRFGDFFWDYEKATKLRHILEAAIQRRFPKGLKVHVDPQDQRTLADLTQQWKRAQLWITRAKVRQYNKNGHTFYLMKTNGTAPDAKEVEIACQASGGVMSPAGANPGSKLANGHKHKFMYTLLHRNTWDGSPGSFNSM